MATSSSEDTNFYWHCHVAALLLESLPQQNAATRAHTRNAIRMATLTAIGKKGIHYATKAAYEKKENSGKNWDQIGLKCEHIFPVSLIHKKVLSEASNGHATSWAELLGSLTQSDIANWNVPSTKSDAAPLSARIAKVVREHSVLAWVTDEDDILLSKKGLSKSMPDNYQGDNLHARYQACGIELIKL